MPSLIIIILAMPDKPTSHNNPSFNMSVQEHVFFFLFYPIVCKIYHLHYITISSATIDLKLDQTKSLQIRYG